MPIDWDCQEPERYGSPSRVPPRHPSRVKPLVGTVVFSTRVARLSRLAVISFPDLPSVPRPTLVPVRPSSRLRLHTSPLARSPPSISSSGLPEFQRWRSRARACERTVRRRVRRPLVPQLHSRRTDPKGERGEHEKRGDVPSVHVCWVLRPPSPGEEGEADDRETAAKDGNGPNGQKMVAGKSPK